MCNNSPSCRCRMRGGRSGDTRYKVLKSVKIKMAYYFINPQKQALRQKSRVNDGEVSCLSLRRR